MVRERESNVERYMGRIWMTVQVDEGEVKGFVYEWKCESCGGALLKTDLIVEKKKVRGH